MEYPKRKKPLFHRPRKVAFYYRYPRTFYYGCLTFTMLCLFSKPIYDMIYHPPTIDPEKLDPEIRKRLVEEGQKLYGDRSKILRELQNK